MGCISFKAYASRFGLKSDKFHAKFHATFGNSPYFPSICFKNGISEYKFEGTKPKPDANDEELLKVKFNVCKEYCIPAANEEVSRIECLLLNE